MSLAEMMYGTASQVEQGQGQGFSQGVQQGTQSYNEAAGLALHKEQLQQQQQSLEIQKQQLQDAKIDKVANWFIAGSKMDDGAAKSTFLGKYIPNGIDAMGLSDAFHPDSLKMVSSNPMVVPWVKNEIAQGRMDPSTLYAAMAQPDKMASLMASTGLKQFGAQENVKAALQESIGGIVKDAEEQAKYKQAIAAASVRAAPMEDRTNMQAHQTALKELTAPSSPIQKKIGAAQSIENSYQAFLASGGLPQEFQQFQNQLRLNQGATGGKTGVAERAAAHASDLGITAQEYVQIATGNPQDVRLTSTKLVQAMKDVGAIETSQIKKQANEAIDTAQAGYKNFYANNPEKAVDYNARVTALRKQVNGDGTGIDNSTDANHVIVNGKSYDKAKVKALLQSHPDDPMAPAFQKALNGG
jgi:hypothetical protein